MTSLACELHCLLNKKERFTFPFDKFKLPKNGIYIIFEKGESFGKMDRIVRIGTHTGENQLRSRLMQHFVKEIRISQYIQTNLSFCVFEVNTKEERLFWESKITSTLSNAAKFGEIKPSENWLGNHSTKDKIRESGLWQVNELYKESLTEAELEKLLALVK